MTSSEIKAEYTSSLADLTFNSKPLINVLTMLAEENLQNASDIVEAIEAHLSKVRNEVKLPILYLIDCIVKNVGGPYLNLFSQNIVSTFCSVFEQVDEKTRAEMFKLRQTWNEVFPQKKLYAIDVQISLLDPAWPVTAKPPTNTIHFNPKFLKTNPSASPAPEPKVVPSGVDHKTLVMHQQLIQKQKELIELQRKKLELELLQTQVKLSKETGSGLNEKQLAGKTKPLGIGASMANQKTSSNIRVNPVNNALATAKKPASRDPRLLRQQKQESNGPDAQTADPKPPKPNRDPRLANSNRDNNNKDSTLKIENVKQSPPKTKGTKSSRSGSKSSNESSNSISPTDSPKKSRDSPKKRDKTEFKREKVDERIEKIEDKKEKIEEIKKEKPVESKFEERNIVDEKRREKKPSSLPPSLASSPTAFKSVKTKSRIFRKNSPSTNENLTSKTIQDEDFRTFGPPEKQLRLQPEEQSSKDVDLRQLPAVIGKKRLSSEAVDQNSAKKSKTGIFDVLFGSEDTDLRQLPAVDRPPTPPPPIISTEKPVETISVKDSPPKPSLAEIRAKLATATKNRDRAFSKSFHKKKLAAAAEDVDFRATHSPKNDVSNQIIISPDDEKDIKSGKMTKDQEKKLLNKLIYQMEKNKLREAQRKEHEESFGNVSLQTISDSELDVSNSHMEDMDTNDMDYDDREDGRYPYNQMEEEHVPYNPNYSNQSWVGPQNNWRGRGRRNNPHMGPRPPVRPWGHPTSNWRHMGPAPRMGPRFLPPPHVPMVKEEETGGESPEGPSDMVVESVNQEDIRTIPVDGIPRDIRYYDETALVFMNYDDPREISFQDGVRRVVINEKDSYMLAFNDKPKEVLINGAPVHLKLGGPSREIYVQGKAYECYFGGPPITIELNGVNTLVKLEGPPPQVKIGTEKRTDLVAGKVNLIIDAKLIIPVFLDGKDQTFALNGKTNTLKFVDALNTVLINDCPFNVEFGGLPKPVIFHDRKHFIRFSVLPRGVRPGYVRIKDMVGPSLLDGPVGHDENSRDMEVSGAGVTTTGKRSRFHPIGEDSQEGNNSNSPQFFQNIMQQNNLDVLSNVLSSSNTNLNTTMGGYQVENVIPPMDPTAIPSAPVPPAIPPTGLNINDLFQKLVATGIVTSNQEPVIAPTNKFQKVNKNKKFVKNKHNVPETTLPMNPLDKKMSSGHPLNPLKSITFNSPESLKIRQMSLYNVLYTGMQCSSCGMRFPPELSLQYSQHLDWHFRQNRRGKKSIRVATSRRWYYSLADWKNYEEIEDLEEREKNFFDQQQLAEGLQDDADDDVVIPTVPADPYKSDEQCEVCKDKFDQFFEEDKEEWHLRNAIRVEEKTYHPVCHEDYLVSLQEQSLNESKLNETTEEQPSQKEEDPIPGLEIVLDDDSDDEVQPTEVIIDESDESKQSEAKADNFPEAEENLPEDEGDDDDVILNEVAPEKIVVYDDDDEERPEKEEEETHYKVKTEKIEIDDGFEEVGGFFSMPNGGHIKIKAEPVDPDDIPMLDTTSSDVGNVSDAALMDVSGGPPEPPGGTHISMDGNIELVSEAPAPVNPLASRIKINISKPVSVIPQKDPKDNTDDDFSIGPIIDPSQPLPPGEEPVQLKLKPGLQGVTLQKNPPVTRGTELSGLCSIM